MVKPHVLVISGDGINCERETSYAFESVGGKSSILTLNQIIEKKSILDDFQIIAFPGGFSFGDELGSGRIFALKIKYQLQELMNEIKNKDKLVIGICNGFQVLVKLGLLCSIDGKRRATLCFNKNEYGREKYFINRWEKLKTENSCCIWTKGIADQFELPIRHGEGRIVFEKDREKQIYMELKRKRQIALSYESNVNGSYMNIAGLCDPSGRVFGLMPHPEAALFNRMRPYDNSEGHYIGTEIFKNSIQYFN